MTNRPVKATVFIPRLRLHCRRFLNWVSDLTVLGSWRRALVRYFCAPFGSRLPLSLNIYDQVVRTDWHLNIRVISLATAAA
jgi:hypothetical protein